MVHTREQLRKNLPTRHKSGARIPKPGPCLPMRKRSWAEKIRRKLFIIANPLLGHFPKKTKRGCWTSAVAPSTRCTTATIDFAPTARAGELPN